MVIIPCHGIWKGGTTKGEDRDEWVLAPFQIEGKDHLSMKEHILTSLKLLSDNTVIVISGGKTKKEINDSEANSYYKLLKEYSDAEVLLEEYARDSFENVIFLICRFYQEYQTYPKKITVVGFEFKRDRFLKHHFKEALGYDNVEYIGNAPKPETNVEEYFQDLHQSEYRHAVRWFEQDWYGIRDPLVTKKLSRNPFNLQHPYKETNPQLKEFLDNIEDDGDKLPNEELRSLLPNWGT